MPSISFRFCWLFFASASIWEKRSSTKLLRCVDLELVEILIDQDVLDQVIDHLLAVLGGVAGRLVQEVAAVDGKLEDRLAVDGGRHGGCRRRRRQLGLLGHDLRHFSMHGGGDCGQGQRCGQHQSDRNHASSFFSSTPPVLRLGGRDGNESRDSGQGRTACRRGASFPACSFRRSAPSFRVVDTTLVVSRSEH